MAILRDFLYTVKLVRNARGKKDVFRFRDQLKEEKNVSKMTTRKSNFQTLKEISGIFNINEVIKGVIHSLNQLVQKPLTI